MRGRGRLLQCNPATETLGSGASWPGATLVESMCSVADEDARDAQERGWRRLAQIDAAYQDGLIDQDGWHQAVLAIVEPAYLSAATPQGGSGHGGSPQEWGTLEPSSWPPSNGPAPFSMSAAPTGC